MVGMIGGYQRMGRPFAQRAGSYVALAWSLFRKGVSLTAATLFEIASTNLVKEWASC